MRGGVQYDVDDAIATVTLDNPGRRNAVSFPIFEQLSSIVATLTHSPEVRVVVLTGAGTDFSVGADLAAPPQSRTLRGRSVPDDVARLGEVSAMLAAFHQLPQITVAAVDGACAGAGLSLAAAADFRIATHRAVFSTAFVNAGLSGDLGAVWLISSIVGAGRARELFLTPRKLSAAEALRIGLVTTTTDPQTLGTATGELAHRLADSAPLALSSMKKNLLQASTSPLTEYLSDEVHRMVHCFHSADAREAAAAFLDKRVPVFAGR